MTDSFLRTRVTLPVTFCSTADFATWQGVRRKGRPFPLDMGHDDCDVCEEARLDEAVERALTELKRQCDEVHVHAADGSSILIDGTVNLRLLIKAARAE